MKVVCKTNITTNGIHFNLTIGKVYEVHRYSPGHSTGHIPVYSLVWVYVIDDSGAKENYIEKMFTPLTELRDIRLEELLK